MTCPIAPPMRNLVGTDPSSFLMGDPTGRGDEQPVHLATLDPFAIGVWPMRNHEYAAFLTATDRARLPGWDRPPFNHPDAPVCGISWYDSVA